MWCAGRTGAVDGMATAEGEITCWVESYVPLYGQSIWKGELRLPAGTPPSGLLRRLGLSEPELQVIVNGRNSLADRPLQDGDEVAVLRHAEGG